MLTLYEIWHMIIKNAENNCMIQMLPIASQKTHNDFCWLDIVVTPLVSPLVSKNKFIGLESRPYDIQSASG